MRHSRAHDAITLISTTVHPRAPAFVRQWEHHGVVALCLSYAIPAACGPCPYTPKVLLLETKAPHRQCVCGWGALLSGLTSASRAVPR